MTENKSTLTLDKSDKSAVAFVAAIKSGERKAQTYVTEHNVTEDNMTEHVAALTVLAFPNVKASSRADRGTREYAAHNFRNAARSAIKRCLVTEDDEPKPVALRVSLSGEGGGSAVVDMTSELGVAILKYLDDQKN